MSPIYWCGVCGEPACEAHMAYHAFVEARDRGGEPDWSRWGLVPTEALRLAFLDFLAVTRPLAPDSSVP